VFLGSAGMILTILTRYPSLADYERIDAELDNDAEYMQLLEPTMSENAHPIMDHILQANAFSGTLVNTVAPMH